MADLLIGYLQNIGLHVLDHADGRKPLHEAAVHEGLSQPMFSNNWETHASHCRTDQDFKALVDDQQVPPAAQCARSFLSAAQFVNFWASACCSATTSSDPVLSGSNLDKSVDVLLMNPKTSVNVGQGWRWVNEGKSPNRPKWGFVSEREGDSLLVKV